MISETTMGQTRTSDVSNGKTDSEDQKSLEEPSPKRQKLGAKATSDVSAHDDVCKDRLSERRDPFHEGGGDGSGTKDDIGCVACYGLLEIEHLKASFQQIIAAVRESGCIFSKFTFQLSMPVTLELRHHAMVMHLKEKFRESFKECGNIDFVSAKEVWKYIVGPMFADHFGVEFSATSGFQVSVTLPSPNAEEECGFLLNKFPECFPNRKQRKHQCREIFTRSAVLDALRKISDDDFRKLYKCPPDRPSKVEPKVEVSCVHSPIYLAGRYRKYSRTLSQTPWILNGKRIMEASVQELITDVVTKHIPNEKIMFSSSGREDVDVRMLGRGRPFVLEIFKTKKAVFTTSDMEAIEQEINANTKDISVSDLQVISKDMTQVLKDGEESKQKTYGALCCSSRRLTDEDAALVSGLKNVTLKQKTPIRVLHRRNLAERERTVYEMSLEPRENAEDGGHRFYLHITTQAGTYIKEFVHSDFGRTVPSLGSYLKADVDILELDVETTGALTKLIDCKCCLRLSFCDMADQHRKTALLDECRNSETSKLHSRKL
ncbi:tRNA pseudouridine synthase Pus10 isoform X4 [Dermacentor albipictus]|uniref:tRNA pseudouridine synthase Pus10 isoform X4 n=1 Tax=Dermacentor albipictus TaxID=60249 RepID=UPI0038FD38EA